MKKILLLILLVSSIITNGQGKKEKKLNWVTHFRKAINISKKEKKPLFIFFTGSDWCAPCKKLEKEVLETPEFRNYADEMLVIYKADFPKNKKIVAKENRRYNDQLKKRFKQKSFPTLVVIDHNGNVLGKIQGKRPNKEYYPFFDKMVEKIKNAG